MKKLVTYLVYLCLLCIYTNSIAADTATKDPVVPVILVLGDSISAGLGIDQSQGWVYKLGKRLHTPYYNYNVVNASISGETTQGGLSRMSDLLIKYDPEIVIIELGGNDGLQGLPLALMEDNLDRMIKMVLSHNKKVLLVGMKLPPNYGKFFTKQFHQIYIDLAKKHNISLVPFLLEGFATNRELMQNDGAQQAMLNNVWPHLRQMLPKMTLK